MVGELNRETLYYLNLFKQISEDNSGENFKGKDTWEGEVWYDLSWVREFGRRRKETHRESVLYYPYRLITSEMIYE